MTGINLDKDTYDKITDWMYAFDSTRLNVADTIVRFSKCHVADFTEFQTSSRKDSSKRIEVSVREEGKTHIALNESAHTTVSGMSRKLRTPRKIMFKNMVAFVESRCDEYKQEQWKTEKILGVDQHM